MRAAEQCLVMLLCRLGQEVYPLHAPEYARLARLMRSLSPVAADEEAPLTERQLAALGISAPLRRRLLCLLERQDVLRDYLSAAPDIHVLTRISEGFPARLRLLRDHCPPVLFCRGEVSLLQTPCIALVGSRQLFPRGKAFAEHIGRLAAREGFTLVSGGAVGADRAAQEACLRAGGRVVCFVPDTLLRYPKGENILYCCDEGYELPFSAARALRRNRFIHALGEKTFVAQCPQRRGGTWSGSVDALHGGYTELYALNDGSEGVMGLAALGAVLVDDGLPSITDLQPRQLSIFN